MRLSPVILALSLAAGGAAAQNMASAGDPQSLVDQLTKLGHDAALDPYDSGRPRITSSISGVNYALAFYGCLDDMTDCRGLMFTAGFDMTDPTGWDVVNDWNTTRVYTRAFLDEEQDPYVQMPVPLASELSETDVRRLIDIWDDALVKFTDEIGFKRKEAGAPEADDPVASAQPPAPAASTRVGPKKAPSSSSLGTQDP